MAISIRDRVGGEVFRMEEELRRDEKVGTNNLESFEWLMSTQLILYTRLERSSSYDSCTIFFYKERFPITYWFRVKFLKPLYTYIIRVVKFCEFQM